MVGGLAGVSQIDETRAGLEAAMRALQESTQSELVRARGELSALVETLRSETAAASQADAHAAASRVSSVRAEVASLRQQHALRLDEAETAISNGTVTAAGLQETVRRRVGSAPHRARGASAACCT